MEDRKNCPSCATTLPEGKSELNYCPTCGLYLALAPTEGENTKPPAPIEEIPEQIGHYRILRPIAKGGMGEVYLAYDPTCRRKVALKRIRADLKNREILYQRFLREAHITSRLAHPGIVPVYTIHHEGEELYYTMPYVEGQTLKQILKEARKQGGVGEFGSIKSLLPAFMGVCQAIAYAHHQGVIHRDLKPENIMVGAYGEVYILDWGISKWIKEPELEDDSEELVTDPELTIPGKVFGTVAYMAPERALGHPADMLSDVYALGVILYEILALNLPFKRESIKAFRSTMKEERLVNPAKVAPYRNVPRQLARMAQTALRPRMSDRYQSVDQLIAELESYQQGRSEWFQITSLDLGNKDHWEFQENVYLSGGVLLTGSESEGGWVSMNISRESFPGNIRLHLRLKLEEESEGVGLMLKMPEASQREHLSSGYTLWIGRGIQLYRSAVQVLDLPHIEAARGAFHDIEMEEVDGSLRIHLNGELIASHVSYLPLPGTHVGLITRDEHYAIEACRVYVGSYSITVDCLAIPDAFLAAGDYNKALSEYRRIAYSFPERDEGREAQFRAGITLLEQAKANEDPTLFDKALEEFGKLAGTSGAPLEYLGKALVYRMQGELDEESKCFELAFRKYRHHPLLHLLQEQVIYLLHAASRTDRQAAYRFLLLIAQHLEIAWNHPDMQRIVDALLQNWEPLPFFTQTHDRIQIAAQLAFWLARPLTLEEFAPDCPDAEFALVELGLRDPPKGDDTRTLVYLADRALRTGKPADVHPLLEKRPDAAPLIARDIWADLLEDEWQRAGEKLHTLPMDQLQHEHSLIHTLFGCWLANTEGPEIARVHFEGVLDRPYPPSWSLLSHYLSGKISLDGQWGQGAFLWEKRQLFRQLHLYYHCIGDDEKAIEYAMLEKEQYLS